MDLCSTFFVGFYYKLPPGFQWVLKLRPQNILQTCPANFLLPCFSVGNDVDTQLWIFLKAPVIKVCFWFLSLCFLHQLSLTVHNGINIHFFLWAPLFLEEFLSDIPPKIQPTRRPLLSSRHLVWFDQLLPPTCAELDCLLRSQRWVALRCVRLTLILILAIGLAKVFRGTCQRFIYYKPSSFLFAWIRCSSKGWQLARSWLFLRSCRV